MGTSKKQKKREWLRYRDFVLSPYGVIKIKSLGYNLLILPRCTERTSCERTSKNGGALFYITVRAEFDFVSTEDGSIHTVVTYGEAMDTSDKATNKAMSIAYKYAAFQAFCIPTEETAIDPDAECHNVAPRSPDEILKDFTAQAVDCLSLAELQAAFEEVWRPLRGTPHRAAAKDVYDIRKSELEEAA